LSPGSIRCDPLTPFTRAHRAPGLLTNYATRPHWRFIAGFVDCRPAILVYDADDPDERIKYFVVLDWAGEKVVRIRDFGFARYAMEGAELAVMD
jgi:RNA polymerase sigma-70 factor (ECF subfamily)